MSELTTSNIDRIGRALKDGSVGPEELVEIDRYRRTFLAAYDQVVAIVRDTLKVAVTGRPSKSTGAIAEKLRRESIRLRQIQDIAGCRIIVDDIPSQDKIVGLLKIFLLDPKIVDRRKAPSFGYRAVHMIAMLGDRCVEIQVRTVPQHLWAEL